MPGPRGIRAQAVELVVIRTLRRPEQDARRQVARHHVGCRNGSVARAHAVVEVRAVGGDAARHRVVGDGGERPNGASRVAVAAFGEGEGHAESVTALRGSGRPSIEDRVHAVPVDLDRTLVPDGHGDPGRRVGRRRVVGDVQTRARTSRSPRDEEAFHAPLGRRGEVRGPARDHREAVHFEPHRCSGRVEPDADELLVRSVGPEIDPDPERLYAELTGGRRGRGVGAAVVGVLGRHPGVGLDAGTPGRHGQADVAAAHAGDLCRNGRAVRAEPEAAGGVLNLGAGGHRGALAGAGRVDDTPPRAQHALHDGRAVAAIRADVTASHALMTRGELVLAGVVVEGAVARHEAVDGARVRARVATGHRTHRRHHRQAEHRRVLHGHFLRIGLPNEHC